MQADARDRFLALLREAVQAQALIKLTLARYRGADVSLKNLLVRPVILKAGPHLAFVWRHATQDITKNHTPTKALEILEKLIGADFLDAHLFTQDKIAQLECQSGGKCRLHFAKPQERPPAQSGPAPSHDREKERPIPDTSPWLQSLGVTNSSGKPKEGMAAKFRQIQKFAELLSHLIEEAGLTSRPSVSVADMGCGKGYLTFAVAQLLGARGKVRGVEARPELVQLCNQVTRDTGFAPNLEFTAGSIADTPLEHLDVLIALHACDTATDDALAQGVKSGTQLLVVSPCCQKELRPQLQSPAVLAAALRHGIFMERQAEFVTDALRAQLLEWAGYRTKVFEFISTEHTAKNLMISAIKSGPRNEALAPTIREFARFYAVKHQALATALGFELMTD